MGLENKRSIPMTTNTQTERCPRCKMTEEFWAGNEGRGVRKDDRTFCCDGCADDTGCTCE